MEPSASSGGSGRGAAGPRWPGRAGLRVLVPGLPQWAWRQRARGAALFGMFAAALAVGAFAWGTPVGLALLGFAFAMHVASAADVVRQGAFPAFGRSVPLISASAALGVGVYGPALVAVSVFAWPGMLGSAGSRDGYLVNRLAYRDEAPAAGHWVWYRRSDGGGPLIGRLVAGPGQGVEWSGREDRVRVAGRPSFWGPSRTCWPDGELVFQVPEGYFLVAPVSKPDPAAHDGLVLVPTSDVLGRAWARLYPVRSRGLLP